MALSSALDAIAAADMVVITIGDLFTSALPNLLVTGAAEALKSTSAKLVYSCNRHTKPGETDHYTVSDYVRQIHTYLPGRLLDYVIVDDTPVLTSLSSTTAENKNQDMEIITYDVPTLEAAGLQVIEDALSTDDWTSIDPAKLAKTLFTLSQKL